MAKVQCKTVPEVNGEQSKLFIDLSKKIRNRPLTALIYAHYTLPGVAVRMDNAGYARNKQGQHSAEDVYKFFSVGTMKTEGSNLLTARKEAGAVDNLGNVIQYTNADDALRNADDFNDRHTGSVAAVFQHGDKFEIVVTARDAVTNIRADRVKEQIDVWNYMESVFRANNLDLGELTTLDSTKELANPVYGDKFLQVLKNLKLAASTNIALLDKRGLAILFTLGKALPSVQNLATRYGSIEQAVDAIWGGFHGGALTAAEQRWAYNAISDAARFNGLDIDALISDVADMSQNFRAGSENEAIQDALRDLDRKYGILAEETHIIGEDIDSLSRAAQEAAISIQRQIRELEKQRGTTAEGKQLEQVLKNLLTELKSNNFYAGTLGFLRESCKQIRKINSLLRNLNQSGTVIENAIEAAKAIAEIQDVLAGYYSIISSLSNIDSLIVDENISKVDKDKLKYIAKHIRDNLEKRMAYLKDLKKSVVTDVATEILGDEPFKGVHIADIIALQDKDLSTTDFLYSIGRASDPMVAAMGKIIRDAQDSRDRKMGEIALRIRRATHALYKSGSNSEFMYDSDNRIISDIDWDNYYIDRKRAIKALKKQGLTGFDLKDAIEQWEDANTEDRVVDMKSGRTEKVPDSNYRKAFPALTPAQQIYYDTMMQIKGEMGTLLPKFAQQQYRPPQLRRSFIDAMKKARSAKDVVKAVRNLVENIWKIREDDTDFARTNRAVIEGQDYNISEGDFNNNPLRDVPIFYINKLEDQGELLKDFSGAMQSLAGTAINYEAMTRVKDLVEVMGDYIKDARKQSVNKNNVREADAVIANGIHIFKDLYKKCTGSNTQNIIDSFINMHIYGVKIKDKTKWAPLIKSLIAYTSMKGLTLNVKGMIANYTVGELQMIIEAAGHEFYGFRDYAWAHKVLFGGLRNAGRIMGMMVNDRNSKACLLAELFDPINDNFNTKAHSRYHKNVFRQLMGGDFTFLGYSAGEYLIHYVNMYAMLHHERVFVDGEEMNLFDAFEVGNKIDGNSELMFKGTDVRDKDGNVIDEAWLENFRRKIRYVNQTTHGSMNEEDKGIIHQKLLGKMAMNFRQWMVEHYSRRFRAEHYDASLGKGNPREGYWRTSGRLLMSWGKGLVTFNTRAMMKWGELTDAQKANCKRCLAENALLLILTILSHALGEPEDHKKEFWYRMFIYQTRRALMEVNASTPWGVIPEGLKMINSPMASLNTINGLLFLLTGWRELGKTIKKGKHKGENAYKVHAMKYALPFWKDIDQLESFDEDESVFQIFNPESSFK